MIIKKYTNGFRGTSDIEPVIEGYVLTIVCVKSTEGGDVNLLMKIDLNNGRIMNSVEIERKPV